MIPAKVIGRKVVKARIVGLIKTVKVKFVSFQVFCSGKATYRLNV